MAKKALLDVLEQTIGKYVKNLDADSLNVAVWSGKIALNNLELDVNAVNAELDRQAAEAPNLALPFQVLSGQFQSFQVDVPWASLTSRSVVLRAQGLHVTVKPYDRLSQTDYLQAVFDSEDTRAQQIRKAREKSMELSEKYRQQAYTVRRLAQGDDAESPSKQSSQQDQNQSSTFSSRLVRRIIENIQIEIKDVHVSLTDSDGVAGVVLDSLSLVTTDLHGKQVFVDRTAKTTSTENSFLYKALLMQGFGVYLDHEGSNTEKYVASKTFLSAIQETVASDNKPISSPPSSASSPSHSYILAPLSFQAKLRQADGSVCVEYAKYQLSSELSSLSILLSRHQLELARKLSKEVGGSSSNGVTAYPLFPEYRPLKRVTSPQSAREWWKYAVRCIGRLNGRRSWVEFYKAYQKRKQYIPLYKRHAHSTSCAWIKPLSSSELETLLSLEQDRTISIEGIMTWRNIADAQVDMERTKHEALQKSTAAKKATSTSYFSSIFGTSTTTKEQVAAEDEDAPPVHLSIEELKELESMAKEDFEEPELSKDSKLCDVKFVLNALKINLTSHDLRHIAALEMGAVSMDFAAAANGAFGFNFDLAHLEIQDRATSNTLFPNVLRSMQGSANHSVAFHLHLSKTKEGDQSLKLKLAAFEAVASQTLFRELNSFISDSPNLKVSFGRKDNPILAQSMSGSVDLFYDADQGASLQLPAAIPEDEEMMVFPSKASVLATKAKTSVPSSDISEVLVGAWKQKAETKAAWMMDVDVKAPVVIIPEKCNDPRASVLVFDLGHLKLTYGKITPADKIMNWLNEHPRKDSSDITLDSGSLAMSDLTFKVGRVNDWRKLVSGPVEPGQESSVIDPISVILDFGVESTSSPADSPRVCCIGVVPTISLQVSPSQGAKVFAVAKSWSKVLVEMGESSGPANVTSTDPGIVAHPPDSEEEPSAATNSSSSAALSETTDSGDVPKFFFMMGLQRLSVTVSLDAKNRVEAHLVSVYVSAQGMEDGSSVVSLRMGWFWVLDVLEASTIRVQRLLVHSELPRPADSFAGDGKYDILGELTKQGVFDSDYEGSTELADVTYQIFSPLANRAALARGETFVESAIDASFSSLFIHWNPYAVKGVTELVEKFASLVDIDDDTSTLILSPSKPTRTRPPEFPSDVKINQNKKLGIMLIKAQMQAIDLHLNSALDDLPLFVLTVSGTAIQLKATHENLEASLSLGDIRVQTPGHMGATLSCYRNLLGLAPGRSESLLTVTYYQGTEAVKSANFQGAQSLEAFAEVELSPMRLCFIQSQVMALVEYTTEGILGALTAKAATSAAQAAIDIADSVEGEKLFRIKATSFDLILPQAAYSENITTIRAGSLDVNFRMFAGTGGSQAKVELSDVALHGTNGEKIQENSIRMSLDVAIPSDLVGSLDDQAMKVKISMSQANFLVSKSQYSQLLHTLDENIGDVELYLRGDTSTRGSEKIPENEQVDNQDERAAGIMTEGGRTTHAGNEVIDKQRRLYLNLSIEELGVQLCNSLSEPLISIAAVKTTVDFQSHPESTTTICKISLRNLVCEDRRQQAETRQYRYIINERLSSFDTSPADSSESENFFFVGYSANKEETSLEVKVGSPQIVLIPDAIREVLAFVQIEKTSRKDLVEDFNRDSEQPTDSSGDSRTETNEERTGAKTRISAETKTCRIVLVDLGSQLSNSQLQNEQLAETLVLQGAFSVSLLSVSETATGKMSEATFDGQADAMEIFSAFGTDMRSPLQILEPSSGSAHGSMRAADGDTTTIEVRAAALTPFDFTLSMHNAALLSAIGNSLQASFAPADTDQHIEISEQFPELTEGETKHIENLVSALEAPTEGRDSSIYQTNLSSVGDASIAMQSQESLEESRATRVQLKFTMPETRITVVNDLQGLDDALFRVSVHNLVAGVEINQRDDPGTTFDCHVNTNVLADYFDTSCNNWNNLIVQPWEVSFRATRSRNHRFKSPRLSTAFDLESFPCCVSFSEQFLVSLASASRMWSIYSVATSVHSEKIENMDASLKASMAASAARNLITSLPYAIENQCGVDVSFVVPGTTEQIACGHGTIQYFRFEPPRGNGFGGKRAYGQDVTFEKTVTIKTKDGTTISIPHLDFEFGLPRKCHVLRGGRKILSHVIKEGKTTVLHLSSHISVVNNTAIPFSVSVIEGKKQAVVGTCAAYNHKKGSGTPLSISASGIASKDSRRFGIPVDNLSAFHKSWSEKYQGTVQLSISPTLKQSSQVLTGTIEVSTTLRDMKKASDGTMISKFDVVCSPEQSTERGTSPLVVQVLLKAFLTLENEVFVDVCLEPRALIENRFPVGIKVRTPMPHTFSAASHDDVLGNDVVYSLEKGDRVEVFTPGPSIAVSIKTSSSSVAGSDLAWLEGGWIDLPLVPEFRLREPVRCLMPFDEGHVSSSSIVRGSEFFVAEGHEALASLAAPDDTKDKKDSSDPTPPLNDVDMPLRTFFVTVCYYGVDHTGDVLFQQVPPSDPSFRRSSVNQAITGSLQDTLKLPGRDSRLVSIATGVPPFSAFAVAHRGRRVTLLPSGNISLRILKMTMEDEAGYRKSLPFYIEELPIGDGGVDTIPLLWENRQPSGYYAYRSIVNEHQAEVHIVPEFLVFNGSQQIVLVKERGQPEVIIEGGQVSRLEVDTRPNGLELALYFIDLECRSTFIRVDALGMKVAILKTNDGIPVGSVCVQTVIDSHGSGRLVVKIGEISRGQGSSGMAIRQQSFLSNDFLRFRVRWTELQIILNEMQQAPKGWGVQGPISKWAGSPASERERSSNELPQKIPSFSPANRDSGERSRFDFLHRSSSGADKRKQLAEVLQQPVATIIFKRFTFDFQRVFKDLPQNSQASPLSPERTQIAFIVHDVVVKDLTPDSAFPMVFDCSSPKTSFLDLCIRVRGPISAEMVKVDLVDLKLAHIEGKSERIKLTTSEAYIWRLLDLMNRIMAASGEFAGYALKLEEDEEHGGFIVKVEDTSSTGHLDEHEYTPPKSDTLYDIDTVRVSPFALLLTFKRNPQIKRYGKVKSNVGGSAFMNYFSQRLKFTIDRADLTFAKYEDRSIRGPPDRLFEGLVAVYMSRMKFKLVTLLSSASLQDWKYLAAREDGNDEYTDGDILRATGNLTGKASNLLLKRVGQTLGDGVSDLSRAVGNTIESTSSKLGARRVGAGVNSVVSGVGDGVGSAVSGVGTGTGKILKGAGQGIGHAFGGVAGGAVQVGRGIGRGITKGDGKAVVEGLAQGVTTVSDGLIMGAGSAATGAYEGVKHAGRGLFSGVKSVGKGIGGAFTGKKPQKKDHR